MTESVHTKNVTWSLRTTFVSVSDWISAPSCLDVQDQQPRLAPEATVTTAALSNRHM